MEQCTDYIYFIKRASKTNRETQARGGSRTLWCLYEFMVAQFFALLTLQNVVLGGLSDYSASHKKIFSKFASLHRRIIM